MNIWIDGRRQNVSSQAADFFGTNLHKLIPRYDKCFHSDSDYVEELKYVRTYILGKIIFLVVAGLINTAPEVTFRISSVYEI
jgi:hypothetical protein